MYYFDWKKALLNNYKNLDLNENEVMIIYLIDFINGNYNGLVTPDLIALKSSLKFNEIDNIFNDLMKKKYINITNKNGIMTVSLDTLIEMLYQLYLLDINSNRIENNEFTNYLNELIEIFETNFNRKLSFVEIDTIKEWIRDGYRKDNILYALKTSLKEQIKSINYVDKLLLKWRKQNESNNEGYTTITDTWHKDISETTKLTDLSWNNKDEK